MNEGPEETLPSREASGLDLTDALKLAGLLTDRLALDTKDGLRAKSVLDYPPGFRFGEPRGVIASQVEQFLAAEPSYVVWSHHEATGRTFTVAYWSDSYRMWVLPYLVYDAPQEVRVHQWLVRALTHQRMPSEQGPVVG